MIEKVNPSHPDKIADRIAGALVDYAYSQDKRARIAVEVLIGHGKVFIIAETSVSIPRDFIEKTVWRIAKESLDIEYIETTQDVQLAENQKDKIRCGDNGIFRGVPLTEEEKMLSEIAREIYSRFPTDGKYILDGKKLTICQSNASTEELEELANVFSLIYGIEQIKINPLGDWSGGIDVDTGCSNRKLGSDMASSVTGGGIQGKDFSKADVSANIYAFAKAQELGEVVEISCSIGDEEINNKPYQEIVDEARSFVEGLGGFEKLAEWGLF